MNAAGLAFPSFISIHLLTQGYSSLFGTNVNVTIWTAVFKLQGTLRKVYRMTTYDFEHYEVFYSYNFPLATMLNFYYVFSFFFFNFKIHNARK